MQNTGMRAVMNRFGRLLIAGAAASAAVRPLPAQAPSPIAWEAFPLRTYDGQSHDVELGRLRVPESRVRPNGSSVSLAFLRLKSPNPSPRAPVVFLMGGPGIPASVMAPIPPYWTLFDALRADADVILLDQRGLGLSTPKLDCPPPAQPLDPAFLTSRAAFVKAYGAVIASCATAFRAQGVDPRTYTDAAIADDIEDIRSGLGVPRVSLLGFSYGTRLALTFARRHLDRVDRVVLQGSVEEDTTYQSAIEFDGLLQRVEQVAAADPATAAFSRDLAARTRTLLVRAERAPIIVDIKATDGRALQAPIDRDGLSAIISERLGDARMPALVATLEAGDVSVLRLWVEGLYNSLSVGPLMAPAVTCSQPPSPARVARVDAESASSVFGASFDNLSVSPDVCSALGGAPAKAVPHLARPLDRPALFITGTFDDRTPRANVSVLQREFTNPTILTVENGRHELLPVPAVREAVVAFFHGLDVRDRVIAVDAPRFLSIEDARQPIRRPGQ
jgi:pimeloyl-ACP methyl ester carboxylesterase